MKDDYAEARIIGTLRLVDDGVEKAVIECQGCGMVANYSELSTCMFCKKMFAIDPNKEGGW